jgi:hypothetical protein
MKLNNILHPFGVLTNTNISSPGGLRTTGYYLAALRIVPTLEGQYILKNLVPVSAGIVIGATVGRQRIGGDA